MSEPTLGEVMVRLDGMAVRMEGIQQDAREARDRARDLAARSEEQNVPLKISELRADMNAAHTSFRSDLVNATTQLKRETSDRLTKLEARVLVLEELRDKLRGAGGVFGWIAANMPWLITLAVMVTAVLEWPRKP